VTLLHLSFDVVVDTICPGRGQNKQKDGNDDGQVFESHSGSPLQFITATVGGYCATNGAGLPAILAERIMNW
jgi:hypothetical protein